MGESSWEGASKKIAVDLESQSSSELHKNSKIKLSKSINLTNKRSYTNTQNIAVANIHYWIALRPTVAIATEALADAGVISKEDTTKVINKNKVHWPRKR